MRIALLSYRSKPHCGGQGVYVRHLSRELVALGPQRRGVLRPALPRARRGRRADQGAEPRPLPRAGPVPGPEARGVPRPDRRRGVPHHVHGRVPRAEDVQPPGRAAARGALGDFDVVHDNQVLGYGMLDIEKLGLPLVTTIHHPITFDRRIDLGRGRPGARSSRCAAGTASCGCRARSPAGAQDPHPVGVLGPRHRPRLRRRPRPDAGHPARRRRRLRAADRAPRARPDHGHGQRRRPMKGIATLLEAFAKLRTERDVELLLVTKPEPGGPHRAAHRPARRSPTRSASSAASATPSWSS